MVTVRQGQCRKCRVTTEAPGPGACDVGGAVLQHDDAGAVVPLYTHATRCVDDVHGARVIDVQAVPRERQSCSDLVHCHLGAKETLTVQLYSACPMRSNCTLLVQWETLNN